MSKVDHLVRRFVPAVPPLARTHFSVVLDGADLLLRRKRREWADLPPASLRMRIGVGNRILCNHDTFLAAGRQLVGDLTSRGVLNPSSAVLELGCGCGRNALALRDYLSPRGQYIGQDVDSEMIAWCSENLSGPAFAFYHANIFSKVYNPSGIPIGEYRLPADDGTVDLVFAISVFSHLLEPEFVHYLREFSRVLAPQGRLYMTMFAIDYMGERLGGRWSFPYSVGRARVESLKYPEAAVAYDVGTVSEFLNSCGLAVLETFDRDLHQQCLVIGKSG